MTAPMAAWMLFRRMPRRPTVEMSAAMVAWATCCSRSAGSASCPSATSPFSSTGS
jgi:hypothetical protein